MGELDTRHTRRDFVVRAGQTAAALGGLGLVACGSEAREQGGAPPPPRRGGMLEVSVTDASTFDQLDPARFRNTFMFLAGALLYDTLARVDERFAVSPGLAESWDASDDFRTWEFRLREGVTFHDGSPLTAQDVVWSLRRAADPELGTFAVVYQPFFGPEDVIAPNPRTVRFDLRRPHADVPLLVSQAAMTSIAKRETNFERQPVGTGPFRFRTFGVGLLEVERHADYWESGRPYLDGVRLVSVPEQSTKVETVVTGRAHLGDNMPPTLAARVTGRAGLLIYPQTAYDTIVFQSSEPPFDHPDVVRALKLSIDRERIKQAVFGGRAAVTPDIPVGPLDPLYPSELQPLPYDPEQARSLFRRAGHDRLGFDLYTSDVFPGLVEIPVRYRQTAQPSGFDVRVRRVQPQTYFASVAGARPASMSNWIRFSATFLSHLQYRPGGGFNEPQFSNPRPSRLLVEAAGLGDRGAAAERVAEACAIINDQASGIIPCYLDGLWPRKSALHGLRATPTTYWDFANAYLAA